MAAASIPSSLPLGHVPDPTTPGAAIGAPVAPTADALALSFGKPLERRRLSVGYRPPADGRIKIAFFDADNTLRVAPSGNLTAYGPRDVALLPHVAAKLKAYADAGYLVAVVSNQSLISDGQVGLRDADAALAYMRGLIRAAGGDIHYLDFADDYGPDRKPGIGMATRLETALRRSFGDHIVIDKATSFMVGDAAYVASETRPDGRPGANFSNSDRLFAQAYGIRFVEPADEFGWRAMGSDGFVDHAALARFAASNDGNKADRANASQTMRNFAQDPARAVLQSQAIADGLYIGNLDGFDHDGQTLFFPWRAMRDGVGYGIGVRSLDGGAVRWINTDQRKPLVVRVVGAELYVLSDRSGVGYFEVLDKVTGQRKKLVRLARPYNHVTSSMLVAANGVYFAADRYLAKFDVATGLAISIPMPRGFRCDAVASDGQYLYAAMASSSRVKVMRYRSADLGLVDEVFDMKGRSAYPHAKSLTFQANKMLLTDADGVAVVDVAARTGRDVDLQGLWDIRPAAAPGDVFLVQLEQTYGNAPQYNLASRILRLAQSELAQLLH